jgi:DNA (cytosine-5)-methyltransferase 1
MTHLDLFSGIGGFAYAADEVFGDVEHIFCDTDPFCRKVLNKHWPEAKIYDDIKSITNTGRQHGRKGRSESPHGQTSKRSAPAEDTERLGRVDLLTGGFPCQPFSAAGVRRGTSDERYLWPEMLRVIRLSKPQWVIAENVGGLLTMQDGMVFEQVCLDLEAAGYEVQPFIIPAVAVNAPHRRDRVWFVGHSKHYGQHGTEDAESNSKGANRDKAGQDELRQPQGADSLRQTTTNSNSPGLEEARAEQQTAGRRRSDRDVTNASSKGLERRSIERQGQHRQPNRIQQQQGSGWDKDWIEVATELCSVDDGLPVELDGFKLSKSKHRAEQLKAYGNAIVPQVAIQIMQGMKA